MKYYLVKVDRMYVAGVTIPHGFTMDSGKAYRFDTLAHALTTAQKYNGHVQPREEQAQAQRAPVITAQDNGAQSRAL